MRHPRSLINLLLASTALAGLGAAPAAAQSLPTGYSTAAGAVSFQKSSGTLTINQTSQSAIVNYNSFSIGQRNIVNIRQPNRSSAILNRVTGSTPSTIAGQLDANGQVYLINPNGVAITKTGIVKVGGGFVASSLAMSDYEWKHGRKRFRGHGSSAAVSNAGTITIGRGGYAALIGGEVKNSGLISAPLGKIGLGSGEAATLDVSGDGFLEVAVPTSVNGKAALIQDSGTISAAGGTVILTAATARAAARNAVDISGSIDAHSISGHNGLILIGGGAGGNVEVSGSLNVSGGTRYAGGSVMVSGRKVRASGAINASGKTGGSIALTANAKLKLAGKLKAVGQGGRGGTITATAPALILAGASVDASGATGGGTVLIGGDEHGAGPLANANTTTIDATSVITADATGGGDGGNVVVWSDETTNFAGSISARGGPSGGDGGNVEVSGGVLALTGAVDVSAPKGALGAILLDPRDLTITATPNGTTQLTPGGASYSAGGTGTDASIAPSQFSGLTGNLDIQTTRNLTVASNLSYGGGSLTLEAGDNLTVNSGVTLATTAGNLTLIAASAASPVLYPTGVLSILGGASANGTVTLSGGTSGIALAGTVTGGAIVYNQPITVTAASTLQATGAGALTVSQPITIQSGASLALTSADALAIDADITAQGAAGVALTYNTGSPTNLAFAQGASLSFTGTNSTTGAPLGSLVINNTPYTLLNALANSGSTGPDTGANDVAGIDNNGAAGGDSGNYALAVNLAGTGTTFSTSLVGSGNNTFSGTLEGFGHTITNLTINDQNPNDYTVGLIGQSSGAVRDIGLVSGSVTAAFYRGDVGALVGYVTGGNIANAYATAAVSGGYGDAVGGLVGLNAGSITNSYATGAVSANGGDGADAYAQAGGLVGNNFGSITNAYATGAVTASASNNGAYAGGLVGENNDATISDSYATGAVSVSGGTAGGLVGLSDFSSLVVSSAYDQTTTGQASGIGQNSGYANIAVLTTAALQSTATANPFDSNSSFSGGAAGGKNGVYPYLTSFFPNGVQAVSGLAYTDGGATPAASSGSTVYNVSLATNGVAQGAVTTGANGYYYIAVAAGTIASGTPVVPYSANAGTGTLLGAALSTPSSTPVNYTQNIDGGAFTVTTSALTYSTLGIPNVVVAGLPTTIDATGASFTLDKTLNVGSSFEVETTASGAGLTVAQPVTVANGGAFGLSAAGALTINAPVTVPGAGSVALNTGTTTIGGATQPLLSFGAGASVIYASGQSGQALTINSQTYTLEYSLSSLASAANNSSGAYALATSVDGSNGGAGYTAAPIASFSGTLEGLGNTVSNLTINDTTANDKVGLFGTVTNGTLRDIGLVGGTVTGADNTSTGYVGALVGLLTTSGGGAASVVNAFASTTVTAGAHVDVGGLVGEADAENGATLIADSYATGAVTSTGSASYGRNYGTAGGLVGYNNAGAGASTAMITGSYATGAVVTGPAGTAGGLAGYNSANSGPTAAITSSYATGAVTSSGVDEFSSNNATLGGLVGNNSGSITNAYATGAVTDSSGASVAGGLVGYNGAAASSATISNAFATGAVSGASYVGGLVGENEAVSGSNETTVASITNAYATGAVNGSLYSGGLVGFLESYGGRSSATVTDAYSTGRVTPSTYSGGSIGYTLSESGGAISVSNVYWDTTTSGLPSDAGGATGLTTAQLQGLDPLSGNAYFSTATNLGDGVTSAFAGGANGLYPYLTSFFPNGVEAVSGAVYSDLGGTTPLASGANGAVMVTVIGANTTLGSATTGANGYYYVFGAPGTIAQGAGVVAYTTANGTPGATNAAGIAASTYTSGTPAQTGVNISEPITLLAGIATTPLLSTSGYNANATPAVPVGSTLPSFLIGAIPTLVATNSTGFTIDDTLDLTNSFAVQTTAQGAPLTVADAITVESAATLGLNAAGTLTIDAPITAKGAAAVALAYDQNTTATPAVTDLSFGLTASGFTGALTYESAGGAVLSSSAGGALTINATPYTLVYSMSDVAGVNGNLGGAYAVANDIDASASGPYTTAVVTPGGSGYNPYLLAPFTGTFEGLGHTISNLTITEPPPYSSGAIGLIGYSTGLVRDLGMVGVNISGSEDVGGLVGLNYGAIAQAFATGSVAGGQVGGLVGFNDGPISQAYATASVTGSFAGGLVGSNYSGGTITQAFATGSVSGNELYEGGLVGFNYGAITQAYATGAVSGYTDVGGLVGYNESGTITQAYATGAVSYVNYGGTNYVGGLVGGSYGGSVNAGYYDIGATGQTSDGNGATGLTTAQLQGGGASLGTAFGGGAGGLYPYLSGFYPNGQQAVSGFAYKDGGATPLALGTGGVNTVSVIANGASLGTATTGANGYYYVVVSGAGSIAAGANNLLAYTSANATTGAANGATLASATGGANTQGVNVYGNAVTIPLSGFTDLAAYFSSEGSFAGAQSGAQNQAKAADGDITAAASAINGATGLGLVTSGALTVDASAPTNTTFVVQTPSGAALTVTAGNPITLGAGGSLGLLSGGALTIDAPIKAEGAASVALAFDASNPTNLVFAQGAALTYTNADGSPATSAVAGQALAINGQSYTLVYNLAALNGIDNAATGGNGNNGTGAAAYGPGLAGNYALAGNIDATGTSYSTGVIAGGDASGNAPTPFSGTLEGLGHTVSNLTIAGANDFVGLFGYSTGTVRDIGIVGGTVAAGSTVGALVGQNGGTVANAYATGSVSGSSIVGGLVGENQAGTVTQAYAAGAVSGSSTLGGLVGENDGVITQAYATGPVLGSANVGGLVGQNDTTITQAYATGAVSGASDVGGLVGLENGNSGAVTNSYYDAQTTGQPLGTQTDGSLGLSTAQMQNGSSAAGLGSAFTVTAGLYPYLASFFPNGVEAISGTAYTDAGVTPAASGMNGAVTVGLIANGASFGTAATGANGYFYVFAAAGTATNGANNLLAYSTTLNAATLTSVDTTAVGGSSVQTGVNLYANAVTVPTTQTSLAALGGFAGAVSTAQQMAEAADDPAHDALAAIHGAAGVSLITSGLSFTVDTPVTTSGAFLVQTTAANAPITVASNAPITIGNGGALGLLSGGALTIDAPITAKGAVAVNLAYDASSPTNLSFAEGAPLTFADASGNALTSAPTSGAGSLTINGQSYTLVYSLAELDAIDGQSAVDNSSITRYGPGLAGQYALAGNLDASASETSPYNYAPIGNTFTGAFEGLGHTIINLTINDSNDYYVGLIGQNNGTVRDIGLVGGSVSGSNYVGFLVGQNNGTVAEAYATGAVSGGDAYGGGLVGDNNDGTITQSYATGAVSNAYYGGGLVGYNEYNGTITQSYATGAVNAVEVGLGGGLAGQNDGTITQAYATGAVNPKNAGVGAIGINDGTVSQVYWDTLTTGVGNGVQLDGQSAGTGYTTGQLQGAAPISGATYFSTPAALGSAFAGGANGVYPYLTNFFPNGVQAVSGTAYQDAGATPLAGNTVAVIANKQSFGSTTTGANGYYYAFGPPGSFTTGDTVLATTSVNSGATNAATLAIATSAANQQNVNIFGNTLSGPTTLTSLTSYLNNNGGTLAAAQSAVLTAAEAADDISQDAHASIIGATGFGLIASGSAFTVDAPVTVTGTNFVVDTTASGAPLTVAAPVTINDSANTSGGLGLLAAGALSINANVTVTGAGLAALAYDQNIAAPSVTDLAFAQGSSLSFTGVYSGIPGYNGAPLGTLVINGAPYTLVNSLAYDGTYETLSYIAVIGSASYYESANYALTANLTGTGTAANPQFSGPLAGSGGNTFTGTFEGLGHTITNLTIASSGMDVGLFGQNSGTIRDVGLVGGAVEGDGSVGALVGINNGGGEVTNAYATSAVGGVFDVGGLVGFNNGGTIAQAYATGAVGGTGVDVGGLVGVNENSGRVALAYATGAVSGGSDVGSLVGLNGGAVALTYATGAVSGGSDVGGLVGLNGGAVNNSYYDTNTTGQTSDSAAASPSTAAGSVNGYDPTTGSIGLTTAQLQGTAPLSGGGTFNVATAFGGATVFAGGAGGLYPYLTTFFANSVQAVSGTVYTDGGVRPLASGPTGAVTVSVLGNGASFSMATTGANGYYYAFGPAGAIPAGQSVLAYTTANAATGATNAAGIATSTYNAMTAPAQSGVNIYEPVALAFATTSQTTYSGYLTSVGGTLPTAPTEPAGPAVPGFVVNAVPSVVTTGASFTIDGTTPVAISSPIGFATAMAGAPLTVANAITVANGGSLGLSAAGALAINAPVTVNGAGMAALAYDQNATAMRSPTDLSFGNGASLTYNDASGNSLAGSTTGAGGALSINGQSYTLLYSLADANSTGPDNGTTDIAGIDANTGAGGDAGNYALATSLTGTGTSTNPQFLSPLAGVNNTLTPPNNTFTGTFEGLGNTITGLTIVYGPYNTGLFGQSNGAIRDIGLIGGSVSGGEEFVGGLVGTNGGTVLASYATGAVTGIDKIGGLVGINEGTVQASYATGAVTGGPAAKEIGGLVGENDGTVETSYATGAVSGGSYSGASDVGGLVGSNGLNATIETSYATGAVTGGPGSSYVGGLVGSNETNATVETSYATGAVSGSQAIGGLVGDNSAGMVEMSYATGAVVGASGSDNIGGLVGESDSGGTIETSYAMGAVSGQNDVGGLVGLSGGPVEMSYATGAVSGSLHTGGLVGFNDAGVQTSYFDTLTTGQSLGIGHTSPSGSGSATGLTTAQLQGLAPISGSVATGNAVYFSTAAQLGDGTTSAFSGGANGLYPYLTSFFPNGVQAVSGVVYSDAGVTPLASGVAGANSVAIIGNGQSFGAATTGANGYYYVLAPAGSLASSQTVLAYTTANMMTGAANAATLTTATGAANQQNVNIYGNVVTVPTALMSLSGFGGFAAAQSAAQTSALGADGNIAAAATAINGATGLGLIASGASFTIDTPVTTASTFLVQTTAFGAPITVASPITIASGGSLGLNAAGALAIDANIAAPGAAGVALTYDAGSPTNLAFAQGASLSFTGVNGATSAPLGSLTINGQAYTLLNALTDTAGTGVGTDTGANDIAGIDNNTAEGGDGGHYALAISLTGTGTAASAQFSSPLFGVSSFSGTFEGLGHTITNLTISDSSGSAVGLIGTLASGGAVRDIGIIGGTVAGGGFVGDLVGDQAGGAIQSSYATGAVSGGSYDGGLVGTLAGGAIQSSYATGAVSGNDYVGGVAGYQSGGATIQSSYATGAVSGGYYDGGLVGIQGGGTIQSSYATGAVSGRGYTGGLVGVQSGGTITNGYYDAATTGEPLGPQGDGSYGLATAQLQGAAALPGGLSFSLGMAFSGGAAGGMAGLYPYLSSFFPNGVQAVSGFAYTNAGATPLASPATSNGLPATQDPGYVTVAANGAALGAATTGANGYYYVFAAAGTLPAGTGVVTYTVADTGANGSGAQNAASYATVGAAATTPATTNVANLNIYGGWQLDQAGASLTALSSLNAADAAAAGALPVASFALVNREIITAASTFTLDTTTNLTGTLALGSTGNVTQTFAGTITADALLLEGADGAYTLTAANTIGTLAASTGSLSVDTAGALTVGSAGDALGATVAGVTTSGPVVLDAGAKLTLNEAVTSAASGDALTLIDATNFVNNDGAGALVAAAGRWLVYSQTPANDALDGLVYAFKQYDAPYNTPPAQATGDGFLYAIAPIISLVGVSKTYDGDTTASLVPGDYAISGVIGGDTVTLSGAAGGFATRNADTGIQVTFGSLAIQSAMNGSAAVYGYRLAALSTPNTIGTINAEAITVTAAANAKTYDGTTSAAATPTLTSGTLYDPAGFTETYDTANAGTGKVLTPSATISDGNGGANYTVTYVANAMGIINALPVTLSGTQTYDGATNAPASGLTVTNVIGMDNVGLTGVGVLASRNAGAEALTLTNGALSGLSVSNANYTLVGGSGAVTVTPEAITVTAAANAKTYDGAISAAATPTVTSGTLYDPASFTETYDTADAGTGKILTPSATISDGAGGANYSVTYVANTMGTINAEAITVTAAANAKTYDATTSAAATPTVTSGTLYDPASFTETYDTADAGTGKILTPSATISDGAGGANYSVTLVQSMNGVISPALLTYVATPASQTYGNANTTFAGMVTGFIDGQTLANATTGTASFASATSAASHVGSYAIEGAGLTANNGDYAFVQAAANATALTVTPATLTITASNQIKTYGQTAALGATAFTETGLVIANGDTISGATLASAGAASSATVAGAPYAINPSAAQGSGLSNYTIGYVAGGLTVNPAPITVTALGGASVYGSLPTNPGLSAMGLQNGQTVSVLTGLSNSFGINGQTSVGAYTVSVAGRLSNANYVVNATQSGVFDVTPRPLTIIANNEARIDGFANPPLAYRIGGLGLVNGDGLTGALATAATIASPIGRYPITQGTLAASGNYQVTYEPGALTIEPSLAAPASELASTAEDILASVFGLPSDALPWVFLPTTGDASSAAQIVLSLDDPRFDEIVVCTGGGMSASCGVVTLGGQKAGSLESPHP